MEQKKNLSENFEKKIRKSKYSSPNMKNQKELEKILSECLTENSLLKKKRSYWSTMCRKLESTEDFALPTKLKDLHD